MQRENTFRSGLNIVNKTILEQVDIALILFTKTYNSQSFNTYLKQKNTIKWIPEINDVSLSGKLINKEPKEPIKNTIVYASVLGKNNQIHMYETKKNGSFFFTLNHLTKKQDVYIGIKHKDSLNIKILINNDFCGKYPNTKQMPINIDTSKHKLIKKLYVNTQVNNSFKKQIDPIKTNTSFLSLIFKDPVISIKLKDFIEIPVMSEVFDELVPFVSVSKNKDKYNLNVYNKRMRIIYDNPLVRLDGIPIFNINNLIKIKPELIDEISVINKIYYLGDFVLNGVIKIKTKTNDFAKFSLPKESIFIKYKTITTGSYPVFPEYNSNTKQSRLPDFRNLLFLKQNFTLKNNKIKFYTSDDSGEYQVFIKANSNNYQYYGKTKIKVN